MTDSKPAAQPVNDGAPQNVNGDSVVRDQFEKSMTQAFIAEGYSNETAQIMFELSSEGDYRSIRVNGAWWGWQASRQAVVVELPEPDKIYSIMGMPDEPDLMQDHAAVVKAIESQGLRVGVAK